MLVYYRLKETKTLKKNNAQFSCNNLLKKKKDMLMSHHQTTIILELQSVGVLLCFVFLNITKHFSISLVNMLIKPIAFQCKLTRIL